MGPKLRALTITKRSAPLKLHSCQSITRIIDERMVSFYLDFVRERRSLEELFSLSEKNHFNYHDGQVR